MWLPQGSLKQPVSPVYYTHTPVTLSSFLLLHCCIFFITYLKLYYVFIHFSLLYFLLEWELHENSNFFLFIVKTPATKGVVE